MKARKILLLFAIVIATLLALTYLFPRNGITVGSLTLRFPTLHSLVERTDVANTEIVNDTATGQMTLEDSIAFYRKLIDSSALRFWLPEPHYFDDFWQSATKARKQKRTIRILHYGDSQIELDHISSRLRANMQRRYGGGGPGMLPFHTTTPTMTVRQSNSGDLIHLASFGDSLAVRSRGNYGLMMQCFRLEGGSATVTVRSANSNRVDDAAKNFERVQLVANNRGGLVAAFTNLKNKKESQQKNAPQGVGSLMWRTDTVTNGIRLHVSGNADLYAITIDADSGGIAVDNIPMRGCSGQQFTLVNEQLLTAAYATLDIGMIILQFGGNTVPYLKDSKDISTYCRSIAKQIAYVHRCCPKAKLLFVGPSDMSKRIRGEVQTYPIIPELIDSLAATATANGAAYWSIYHAMGGLNTMPQWTRQGLAGNDYIHFSQKGADKMGDLLAEAFDNSHSLYILEQRWAQLQPKAEKKAIQKSKAKTNRKARNSRRKRGGGR